MVESAEGVVTTILTTYNGPNLTPEEFRAWAGERNDPLREFGNVCRREIDSLWKLGDANPYVQANTCSETGAVCALNLKNRALLQG